LHIEGVLSACASVNVTQTSLSPAPGAVQTRWSMAIYHPDARCPVCSGPLVAVTHPRFVEDSMVYPIQFDIVGWYCTVNGEHPIGHVTNMEDWTS
jgi:hypothetical protein